MSISIIPFLSETDSVEQLYVVRQVVDGHEVRQQTFNSMEEAEKEADTWKTESSQS